MLKVASEVGVFMNDQDVPTEEAEDIQWTDRSKADIDRARTTLSMLPGVIAILRYDCGCKSPQGICIHHSLCSGLVLPYGVICDRCKNEATLQVSGRWRSTGRSVERREFDSCLPGNQKHPQMSSSPENRVS
jgi:hypothetical protein